MSGKKPRMGCIGAGVLGSAIMRRLIDCGYEPAVWNRDRSKLADVIKAGATGFYAGCEGDTIVHPMWRRSPRFNKVFPE